MARWFSLLVFLGAVAAVAAFAASFEPGDWYEALHKPVWTPPNWLFGPVWIFLYALIALAGWLVWRAEGLGPALMAWIVQLVLNGAWSFVMFGAHQIAFSLTIIVLLWVTILIFMILARPVSRTASVLFVPYWAWTTYAALLNFQIWRLN